MCNLPDKKGSIQSYTYFFILYRATALKDAFNVSTFWDWSSSCATQYLIRWCSLLRSLCQPKQLPWTCHCMIKGVLNLKREKNALRPFDRFKFTRQLTHSVQCAVIYWPQAVYFNPTWYEHWQWYDRHGTSGRIVNDNIMYDMQRMLLHQTLIHIGWSQFTCRRFLALSNYHLTYTASVLLIVPMKANLMMACLRKIKMMITHRMLLLKS